MTRKVQAPSPLLPHDYTPADARAFQMLAEGKADERQQLRALKWLIDACGTYDEPFRPGGTEAERDTAYACGKRNIGMQIVKLLNVNITALEKGEKTP